MGVAETLAHELGAALPDDGTPAGMEKPAGPRRGWGSVRPVAAPDESGDRHADRAHLAHQERLVPGALARPAKVTHAGGLYQVIPVGVFQPASGTPESDRSDLSLRRAMVREFSEELLGTSEAYTSDVGSFPSDTCDFTAA